MSVEASLISVSLNEGITWTTNWRDSDHRLLANSFIFKAEDFRKILEEPTVEYVRLYLGLKISHDFNKHDDREQNTIVEKLICVGADHNQQDILQPRITSDVSGIYDFSHPCPPICDDEESPLAGGEQ